MAHVNCVAHKQLATASKYKICRGQVVHPWWNEYIKNYYERVGRELCGINGVSVNPNLSLSAGSS